jgi:hypothetical protein
MSRGSLSTDDLAGRQAEPYPQESATQAAPEQQQTDQQAEQYAPLLEDRESGVFLDRWREVQARFVDDPQAAVRDGDALVAELMQALASRFSEQKGALQQHWDTGSEPETEQLRRTLQEYRSFFQRLLST